MHNPKKWDLNQKKKSFKSTGALVTTSIVIFFSIYLYLPHFRNFEKTDLLILINTALASLGCYILSSRWVTSSWARFFAAVSYGFGPYMLGLAKFHPAAGSLAALLPWLFCPAALWFKGKPHWLQLLFSALPFVAILLFFKLSAEYGLYPVPIQTQLNLNDLSGLPAPLAAAERQLHIIGFYHVSLATLLMGSFMTLAARRIGLIIIFIAGTILAFCQPIFEVVSPLSWLNIPVLCGSILIGTGIQALASAGPADKKWLLLIAGIMGGLSVLMLLLARKYSSVFAGLGEKYAGLFTFTAYMYILATVVTGIIFFMTCAKLRLRWLRLAIISSALGVDIFYSAQLLIRKIL